MYSIIKANRRRRYINFHITFEENTISLTNKELILAICQQTQHLFSKTTKELGIWVKKFDGTNGIIQCNHKEKDHTIQILNSIKRIGSKSLSFNTDLTSGTIRGINRKNLKHN